MESFEFPFTMEFTLIHRYTDLVRFRFHLFISGIQHRGGSEIDNPSDFALVERLDKTPDLGIDAERIVRITQKQNINRICDGC